MVEEDGGRWGGCCWAGIIVERDDIDDSDDIDDIDDAVRPGEGAELDVPFPALSLEKYPWSKGESMRWPAPG